MFKERKLKKKRRKNGREVIKGEEKEKEKMKKEWEGKNDCCISFQEKNIVVQENRVAIKLQYL